MNSITTATLNTIVSRINVMTGNPTAPYTKDETGKNIASIGNYHVSGAYGGVCLHQMVNNGGGVRDVFSCGHVTRRQLADLMYAFVKGYEEAKGLS